MINFLSLLPPPKKRHALLVSVCMVMQHGVGTKNLLLHAAYSPRYIVLIPLRAPTKVGEHSGLVLTFGVKQAANAQTSLRQAKQCTALFCPHSLTIELVPKLIDYALKRMVRKFCFRWNSFN